MSVCPCRIYGPRTLSTIHVLNGIQNYPWSRMTAMIFLWPKVSVIETIMLMLLRGGVFFVLFFLLRTWSCKLFFYYDGIVSFCVFKIYRLYRPEVMNCWAICQHRWEYYACGICVCMLLTPVCIFSTMGLLCHNFFIQNLGSLCDVYASPVYIIIIMIPVTCKVSRYIA